MVLTRVVFGVRVWNPLVDGAVAGLLTAATLAAMLGPALSDPMQALWRD